MLGEICNIVILVWSSVPSAVGQLPLEIQMDRYVIGATRLMANNEPEAALSMMNKVLNLHESNENLNLPKNFNFKYAQIAFSAGRLQTAIDYVNKYLAKTTRAGDSYWEALKLLDTAEASLPNTNQCDGRPKGTACWMKLADPTGCYVWNPNLQLGEKVTWEGKCIESLANGPGTLKWVWAAGEKTVKTQGRLQTGRRQGHWIEYFEDGYVAEGSYKTGKRHGEWVLRGEDGNIIRQVLFEKGKKVSSKR